MRVGNKLIITDAESKAIWEEFKGFLDANNLPPTSLALARGLSKVFVIADNRAETNVTPLRSLLQQQFSGITATQYDGFKKFLQAKDIIQWDAENQDFKTDDGNEFRIAQSNKSAIAIGPGRSQIARRKGKQHHDFQGPGMHFRHQPITPFMG